MPAVVMKVHRLRNGKEHRRCWRLLGRTVLILILERLDGVGDQVAEVKILRGRHQLVQGGHMGSHGFDLGDRADRLLVAAHV